MPQPAPRRRAGRIVAAVGYALATVAVVSAIAALLALIVALVAG